MKDRESTHPAVRPCRPNRPGRWIASAARLLNATRQRALQIGNFLVFGVKTCFDGCLMLALKCRHFSRVDSFDFIYLILKRSDFCPERLVELVREVARMRGLDHPERRDQRGHDGAGQQGPIKSVGHPGSPTVH